MNLRNKSATRRLASEYASAVVRTALFELPQFNHKKTAFSWQSVGDCTTLRRFHLKLNAHKGGTSVDPAYRMRDAWPGDGNSKI